MSKNKRINWSFASIIVVGLLLNGIIITTAYFHVSDLLWLLLITLPLFTIVIYSAKQRNHTLNKYRFVGPQAAGKQSKYERPSHSLYPNKIEETELKVTIGNDQCSQPYYAYIISIYSLQRRHPRKSPVQIFNDKKYDYSIDSVDETLPTYYLTGEDLVWQIGPDYLGCRTENGNFNSNAFKENACRHEVKMIELMLSSPIRRIEAAGSNLDIRNMLSQEISITRFPNSPYSGFWEAEGMIHFLDSLRELSGRKPTGMRLCISDKKEFREICYAIRKTEIIPDFMVVEGPFENMSHVYPNNGDHTVLTLYEAILFVTQTLQVYGLEKKIKIIASGTIGSSIDILKILALGANAICTEMPTYRSNDGENISLYKGQNVNDFHNKLMNATVQAMKVWGFRDASDITLSKFFSKLDILRSKGFETLNDLDLLSGKVKKIYNSQMHSYQIQEEGIRKSIV